MADGAAKTPPDGQESVALTKVTSLIKHSSSQVNEIITEHGRNILELIHFELRTIYAVFLVVIIVLFYGEKSPPLLRTKGPNHKRHDVARTL